MRAVVMHAPGDVRVEEIDAPVIVEPTDAIIRVTATCVCGSDLWPYRGIEELNGPTPMGHEYVGVVEQVGPEVNDIEVGDFVVGSFVASDNTCEICEAGFQSRCIHQVMMGSVGTQSEYARGRHPRPCPRRADRAAGSQPPCSLRRTRHRLVRRRSCGSRTWQNSRRRRRRRSRTPGDPRCQTTRRRADHRHVTSRRPAGTRHAIRRHRHRRRAGRRGHREDQGTHRRLRRPPADMSATSGYPTASSSTA